MFNKNMNSVLKSSLLALMVLASSNVSYALRVVQGVSTEQAIQRVQRLYLILRQDTFFDIFGTPRC